MSLPLFCVQWEVNHLCCSPHHLRVVDSKLWRTSCSANESRSVWHRDVSVQSLRGGGGARSERAGTEETVASSRAVSGIFGVVVRSRGATAVIMIEYNGAKWKDHELRSLSTPTETWTGRKDATAVWSRCRYRYFLDITQWTYRNLCHPGLKKDKGGLKLHGRRFKLSYGLR